MNGKTEYSDLIKAVENIKSQQEELKDKLDRLLEIINYHYGDPFCITEDGVPY